MSIAFASLSAGFFAESLAKATGLRYWQCHSEAKPKDCDTLFLVGLYHPGDAFYKQIASFRKTIILFAGTDILQLQALPRSAQRSVFASLLKDRVCFATEAPTVKDRIKDLFGLRSEIVYIPSKHVFPAEEIPLPKTFAVGCYMPPSKLDFYHHDLILGVAAKFPTVPFHLYSVVGYNHLPSTYKGNNIVPHPTQIVDMPPFLAGLSCGIRITAHDTYTMSAIEYSQMGRWFINNYSMPFCDEVAAEPSVDEVAKVLADIQNRTEPNHAGRAFYRKNHDPKTFLAKIKDLLK